LAKLTSGDLIRALFGVLVLSMLAANLVLQLQIARSFPPTLGDLRAAESSDERRAILERTPLTRVEGVVGVTAAGPLPVEVNEPLDVYIVP
jgi:hypothetical protein